MVDKVYLLDYFYDYYRLVKVDPARSYTYNIVKIHCFMLSILINFLANK